MGHFYFVRHGQTVWNVENKICGATDSPLTEYAAWGVKNCAVDNGIKTLAFPSISTGVYSYPIDNAATIAVKTVRDFCVENPGKIDTVRFVLFSDRDLAVYDHAIAQLQ